MSQEEEETLRARIRAKIGQIKQRCSESFMDACDQEQIEMLEALLSEEDTKDAVPR